MTAEADIWIAAMKARAQPCAALVHADPEAGNGISPARLGGLPTIAGTHEWPSVEGRSLSFVGEIDLVGVGAVFRPGWLPESGTLHFFYDMVDEPWGFDPADRGHWAVLYSPAAAPRSETIAPADFSGDFVCPQVGLAANAASSYPDPLLLQGQLGLLADLPESEWQTIDDFRTGSRPDPLHQVGGYASPIQQPDMELQCQLASNGIYLGGPEGYRSPEAAALASGAADWRLLLQVDSDDGANMMWGDSGMLYFFVREQDARKGDFSRVWLVLQCC